MRRRALGPGERQAVPETPSQAACSRILHSHSRLPRNSSDGVNTSLSSTASIWKIGTAARSPADGCSTSRRRRRCVRPCSRAMVAVEPRPLATALGGARHRAGPATWTKTSRSRARGPAVDLDLARLGAGRRVVSLSASSASWLVSRPSAKNDRKTRSPEQVLQLGGGQPPVQPGGADQRDVVHPGGGRPGQHGLDDRPRMSGRRHPRDGDGVVVEGDGQPHARPQPSRQRLGVQRCVEGGVDRLGDVGERPAGTRRGRSPGCRAGTSPSGTRRRRCTTSGGVRSSTSSTKPGRAI